MQQQNLDNTYGQRRKRNSQIKWCFAMLFVAVACVAYLVYISPGKKRSLGRNKHPLGKQKQQQETPIPGSDDQQQGSNIPFLNFKIGNINADDNDVEDYKTTTYEGNMHLFSTTVGNWQDMMDRPHYQAWDYSDPTTTEYEPQIKAEKVPEDEKEKGPENKLPQIPPPKDVHTPSILISKIKESASKEDEQFKVVDDKLFQTTDPLKLGKIDFMEKFRNPCFIHEESKEMYCLPAFFILGMPRSGTNDLYIRLSNHPNVVQTAKHSPAWWNNGQTGGKILFSEYLTHFRESSKSLQNVAEVEKKEGITKHNSVLFDFNPTLFWRGKVGDNEAFMTPAHIKQVLPASKLILLVRDPVERLYSEYFHFSPNGTPEKFEAFVKTSISAFGDCLEQETEEKTCVHKDLGDETKPHLEVGLYVTFYEEWLAYFSSSDIMIIAVEEYGKDLHQWLEKICDFVGIPPVSETVLSNLASNQFDLERKSDRPAMKESTRKILSAFYSPYNERLSKKLNSNIFKYEK